MQVLYNAVGSLSGYTLIVDTGMGGTLKEFSPEARPQVTDVPLAVPPQSAGGPFRMPYGNVRETFTLDFVNTYANATTALAQARVLKQNIVSAKNNIQVNEGAEVQYYPNGACNRFRFEMQGCSVHFMIDMSTDLVQTTPPA